MYQWREHVSKEETFIKWVKRLRLSAFTTSQPRTFFWLWLMLVMWCYEYIIQFIVMVPSSSYYIIRTEILILQWNKAGMTFLNWNQLWLWNLFAILNAFVCCAGDHPAPRQCGHQQQLGPVFPWLYELCGEEVAMVRMQPGAASAAWSRPRLGTSRSSTSPSRSPSTRCLSEDSSQLPSKWPERYHAVMISARAVRQYAHLPGSVSQFLHQLTYHEEGIFSIFTICEEGVFSRFPLIYSHFHSRLLTTSEKSKISSENFLQPPQGQQSKSCRRWTPPSAVRLPPYHEKASVSCAFCLNMTFLVNKGR